MQINSNASGVRDMSNTQFWLEDVPILGEGVETQLLSHPCLSCVHSLHTHTNREVFPSLLYTY